MKTILAVPLLVVAATLTGLVADGALAKGQSWLSRELAGRTAGAPADCIELPRVEGPMIVDSRTILYRQSGKRIWRADVGETCTALREDMSLIVRPSNSRLCRNDLFQPIEPGARIPGATCRFGKFVPYDKP